MSETRLALVDAESNPKQADDDERVGLRASQDLGRKRSREEKHEHFPHWAFFAKPSTRIGL